MAETKPAEIVANPYNVMDASKDINYFNQVGSLSLKRWGGYITEEFLMELQGVHGIRIYTEMKDNDAVTGALLLAVSQLIRRADWRVEGKDEDPRKKLLEESMDDMEVTWEEFISDVCSMFPYGWDVHEMVFKLRKGQEPGEDEFGTPLPTSKYNDGKIGWGNFVPVKQNSLYRWDFGEGTGKPITGKPVAIVQQAYPDLKQNIIPLSKCLHFKTEAAQGNPEGKSIMRNAYRSWMFRKNFEVIMGIGVERDLAGFPVLYIPAQDPYWHEEDEEHAAAVSKYEDIIKKMRRDENDGLILPSLPKGPEYPEYKMELLSSGSRRPVDIKDQLVYYDNLIANAALAQFLLLGTGKSGSFALGETKQDLFQLTLNGWLQYICAEINRKAVPLLLKLNGMSLDDAPQFKADPIEVTSLTELADFISKCATCGAITLDPGLEDNIRSRAKLPPRDENFRPVQEIAAETKETTLDQLKNPQTLTPDEQNQASGKGGFGNKGKQPPGKGKQPPNKKSQIEKIMKALEDELGIEESTEQPNILKRMLDKVFRK